MKPVSRPDWKYHVGARRSTPEQKASATPAHLHPKIAARLAAHESGAAPLPLVVDKSSFSPGVLNQSTTGGCASHAFGAAAATSTNAQGRPIFPGNVPPSPKNLYAPVRAKERSLAQIVSAGAEMPKLADVGSQLATVMWVATNIGVVPMQAPSPLGFNSDVDESNVLDEPQIQEIELAGKKLLVGPYLFDLTAPNASDVMAAALDANIMIQIAFLADDALQNLEPGQILGAPVDGPEDGGHSVYIPGYYTFEEPMVGLPAGTRIWQPTNSWGTGWCSAGRGAMGPASQAAWWEAWAVSVTTEGAVS